MEFPLTEKEKLTNFLQKYNYNAESYFNGDYYKENLTDKDIYIKSTVQGYLYDIIWQSIFIMLSLANVLNDLPWLTDKVQKETATKLLTILPAIDKSPHQMVFRTWNGYTYKLDTQIAADFINSATISYAHMQRDNKDRVITKQLYEGLTIEKRYDETEDYRLFKKIERTFKKFKPIILSQVSPRDRENEAEWRLEFYRDIRDNQHDRQTRERRDMNMNMDMDI